MSGVIINPNAPLQETIEPPLVIEQSEDGSARLVHRESGAFIAFFKNGTILMRDSLGSGIQTLPTGDVLVGAIGNVINLGKNIAFRGQQPEEIAWVFENKDEQNNDDQLSDVDESSSDIYSPTTATVQQFELGSDDVGSRSTDGDDVSPDSGVDCCANRSCACEGD
jgi:hypothetical protein